MASSVVVLCAVACLAVATAQRPAPISGDEAGPGPAASEAPAPPTAPVGPQDALPAPHPASPASRQGCTLGSFHPVGDTWFTNGREGCLKYTCQRVGVVSSQPCPRVPAPEGCSVKEGDADAVYPACCSRRECTDTAVPLPAVVDDNTTTTTAAATSPASVETTSGGSGSTQASSTTPSSS